MVKKDPFQVSVNDHYLFDVKPEDVHSLDVVPNGDQAFHLLENGQAYQVKLLESDFSTRSYTLQVNGVKYSVRIADYYERLVKQLGLSIGSAQKINTIKAPMPGLVITVLVRPGQQVQKDDALLILEAMKMENVIKAAGDGVVKSVNAEKGQSVDKGHILLEFE
jgi:biotin carboxyl carrier protein